MVALGPVMVAAASATQDIVIDAFRVESLDTSEQAAGMASYVFAYRIGMLVSGAGVIALVGFAEASSIARTYATQDRLPWDAKREFISQGMANLTAGLFGGFPVGGSFARSSINRLSGATSGWSGAVMGLAVLAFMPFTGILSALPRAIRLK